MEEEYWRKRYQKEGMYAISRIADLEKQCEKLNSELKEILKLLAEIDYHDMILDSRLEDKTKSFLNKYKCEITEDKLNETERINQP